MLKYAFSFILLFIFSAQSMSKNLTLGSVSKEPAEEIAVFLPFAKYLAAELKEQGIDAGKVVVTPDVKSMSAALQDGAVDIYIDSPIPVYGASLKSGAKLMARRWKKGVAEYHSVIFVKADSGIESLGQLQGKVLAFESPFSSSGYFLPKMALLNKGFSLKQAYKRSASVASDEIGYFFSRDEENTLLWVERGIVSAGVMGSQQLAELLSLGRHDIKVLYQTPSVPRHVVVYRQDLDSELVERVRQVMMAMSETEAGQLALAKFQKTTKFDPIPLDFKENWRSNFSVLDAEF